MTSTHPIPLLLRCAAAMLLVAASLGAACAQARRPVVLDNDWAIDDWTALLYLARHPGVELRAVTVTGTGEAHCPGALAMLPRLMDLAALPSGLPFACSNAAPLDGFFVFPEPWRTDSDVMSNVALPPGMRTADAAGAVEVLHRAANLPGPKLLVVATGPLTNIAQWFARYPHDIARIDELVIMGGAVRAKGNIVVPKFTAGHPNAVSEWNFYIDPVAADRVLRSKAPIRLVPLDVTNKVRVTAEYAADFKQKAVTPAAHFVDQVFDRNDWFIASGEYYFWDLLAAIVATEPEYCTGEDLPLAVIHRATTRPYAKGEDASFGTKRDGGGVRHHLDAATAGRSIIARSGPAHHVCFDTQPAAVMARFTEVMNR